MEGTQSILLNEWTNKHTENGEDCMDGSHQYQKSRFDVMSFFLKLFRKIL